MPDYQQMFSGITIFEILLQAKIYLVDWTLLVSIPLIGK